MNSTFHLYSRVVFPVFEKFETSHTIVTLRITHMQFDEVNTSDIADNQNLSTSVAKDRSNDTNDSTIINSDQNELKKKDHIDHEEDEDVVVEEEEPDWDTIAQHEPARNDVPIFLTARDRREEAEARFGAALDEAHATFKQCCDDFLKIAANLFHDQKEKLLAMEDQIKQDFVENEASRSQMQKNLEQSASAAQEQFAQLMRRVTQMNKKVL